MSYQSMSDLYRGQDRGRYEMAISEQGMIAAQGVAGSDQQLGAAVVSGDLKAIDSVIRAITTGPNSATLDQDPALLSAVQSAWGTVANALYPAGA